jgi:hypothetical protein
MKSGTMPFPGRLRSGVTGRRQVPGLNRMTIMRLSAFGGLCLTFLAGQTPDSARRGYALFHGQEALAGRIRGHDEGLPAEALRCANCHEATSRRLTGVAAPHVDRSLLLEYRQRRGGPPSRYDAASFCKLLRTGADPVFIVIAREMPVYDLNEAQCNSLWTFFTEKDTRNDKE